MFQSRKYRAYSCFKTISTYIIARIILRIILKYGFGPGIDALDVSCFKNIGNTLFVCLNPYFVLELNYHPYTKYLL